MSWGKDSLFTSDCYVIPHFNCFDAQQEQAETEIGMQHLQDQAKQVPVVL